MAAEVPLPDYDDVEMLKYNFNNHFTKLYWLSSTSLQF